MKTPNRFFILALNATSQHLEEIILDMEFKRNSWKEVKSYWKGKEERSYVINDDRKGWCIKDVRRLARHYEQEAYLMVENGYAFLYSKGDDYKAAKPLGLWQE